jgi:hypothetical protein
VISVCPTMLPPRCETPPGGPWEGDAARLLDDWTPASELWRAALLRAVALGYVASGAGHAFGRCGFTVDAYTAAGFAPAWRNRLLVEVNQEAGSSTLAGSDFSWSKRCTGPDWGGRREWWEPECLP